MELDKIPWGDIGPSGLVVIVVMLLFTGRLVTRAVFEDMREQRDLFRAAWKEAIDANRAYDERLDTNTDALSAVEAALRAVVEGDRRA